VRDRIATAASTVAIAALFAFAAAAAPTLRQGDVLISDATQDRILYVDPTNGHVEVFSPRGTDVNLLDAPAGIEIDPTPDGAVYVVSSGIGRLVRIDPSTGAQSLVNAFDDITFYGPIALGADAAGLAMSEIWGTNDPPDLYVSYAGGIDRIVRNAGTVLPEPLVTDVALINAHPSIALRESNAGLFQVFAANPIELLGYELNTQTFTPLVQSQTPSFVIHDVDFSFLNLTFSLGWPCADPNGFSGIYEYPLENGPAAPLAIGGLVDCPVAHRQAGYSEVLVINAEPPSGNQLVRLDFNGAGWDASPVADLGAGDLRYLAVSPITFAPEPDAALLMFVALGALAVQRARSRR